MSDDVGRVIDDNMTDDGGHRGDGALISVTKEITS